MGWFDNLDSELDNQPGPSGFNQRGSVIAEFITQTDVEPIDMENETVAEPTDHKSSEKAEESDEEPKEEYNAFKEFAEGVTIAGLEEAYSADFRPTRIMFRVALLLAFAMIIYQAIAIVDQYKEQNTVFVDVEVNQRAPFPNVTVCFDPAVDEAVIRRWTSKYEILHEVVVKYNFTETELTENVRRALSLQLKNDLRKSRNLYVGKKFMRVAEMETDLYLPEVYIPPCPRILSNCAFGNLKFNCCEIAQYMTILTHSCYHLSVSSNVYCVMLCMRECLQFLHCAKCTVHSAQCTVRSAQGTVRNTQIIVCIAQFNVQCAQCTVRNAAFCTVHCAL